MVHDNEFIDDKKCQLSWYAISFFVFIDKFHIYVQFNDSSLFSKQPEMANPGWVQHFNGNTFWSEICPCSICSHIAQPLPSKKNNWNLCLIKIIFGCWVSFKNPLVTPQEKGSTCCKRIKCTKLHELIIIHATLFLCEWLKC